MINKVIRCVLSGSFRRDEAGLLRAYDELITCGCQVISPHRLEFDSQNVLFVKDKAEQNIPENELERHHLLSINQSDFVWIHAPKGYVGLSGAFEIGFAHANNIPIFSHNKVEERMLQPFIQIVPSVYSCLEIIADTT